MKELKEKDLLESKPSFQPNFQKYKNSISNGIRIYEEDTDDEIKQIDENQKERNKSKDSDTP